ncbi:uncharacterized protein LOC102094566 isoform X2 [Columba livia]|uniref:uncharacterized protein LOC102094566 isoform X2 n=1 Tax=Columba livia TaxID=8932 RepID=UPI0031B9C473
MPLLSPRVCQDLTTTFAPEQSARTRTKWILRVSTLTSAAPFLHAEWEGPSGRTRDLRKPRLDLERMCLASGCDPFGNEVILQLPRKKIPTELAVWQERAKCLNSLSCPLRSQLPVHSKCQGSKVEAEQSSGAPHPQQLCSPAAPGHHSTLLRNTTLPSTAAEKKPPQKARCQAMNRMLGGHCNVAWCCPAVALTMPGASVASSAFTPRGTSSEPSSSETPIFLHFPSSSDDFSPTETTSPFTVPRRRQLVPALQRCWNTSATSKAEAWTQAIAGSNCFWDAVELRGPSGNVVPLPSVGERSRQPCVHNTATTLKFAFCEHSATFAVSTNISARSLVCLNI